MKSYYPVRSSVEFSKYKKSASKMKYVANKLDLSEADLEGIWNES